MRRSIFLALMGGVSLFQAAPSFAQSNNDIIMRRPLPGNGEPEVPSTPEGPVPQPGERAYVFEVDCSDPPTLSCYEIEVVEGGGSVWNSADASMCQQQQSPRAVEVGTYEAGASRVGRPGVDAAQFCSRPSIAYGWYGSCWEGGEEWYCDGVDRETGAWVYGSAAQCQNQAPLPASFYEEYGLYSNEAKEAADLCTGEPPEEPEEPEEPVEEPEIPGHVYTFTWDVGAWQGAAACGQQSTMTRMVRCARHDVTYGYAMDPVIVADARCEANASEPRPSAVYSGTQAGCDTEVRRIDEGDWILPEGAEGTATCSPAAERYPVYGCFIGQSQVPMDVCFENYSNGGTRQPMVVEPEVGNFEGCVAEWKKIVGNTQCSGTTLQREIREWACIKNDERLTGPEEAACAANDRPFAPSMETIGTCRLSSVSYSTNYAGYRGNYCGDQYGNSVPSNMVQIGGFTALPAGQSAPYEVMEQAYDMCRQAGAEGCRVSNLSGSNQADAPYTGLWVTIWPSCPNVWPASARLGTGEYIALVNTNARGYVPHSYNPGYDDNVWYPPQEPQPGCGFAC